MKNLNLNIISKKVKAKNRKLKATWSNQSMQNISSMMGFSSYMSNNFYQYKFENQEELEIIDTNFIKEELVGDIIFYILNNKIKRKIKLLKLNNDELGTILEKILEKSKIANAEDILTAKLSREIAESIDREIIKDIMNLK